MLPPAWPRPSTAMSRERSAGFMVGGLLVCGGPLFVRGRRARFVSPRRRTVGRFRPVAYRTISDGSQRGGRASDGGTQGRARRSSAKPARDSDQRARLGMLDLVLDEQREHLAEHLEALFEQGRIGIREVIEEG